MEGRRGVEEEVAGREGVMESRIGYGVMMWAVVREAWGIWVGGVSGFVVCGVGWRG